MISLAWRERAPGPHAGEEEDPRNFVHTQFNTNDMTAIRMKGKRVCNGVYQPETLVATHGTC
jgi:hypothetical protein